MTTILVADPRQAIQTEIEETLRPLGVSFRGQPDLVITPDPATAKFWSRQQVPVLVYSYEDAIDVTELVATVLEFIDP